MLYDHDEFLPSVTVLKTLHLFYDLCSLFVHGKQYKNFYISKLCYLSFKVVFDKQKKSKKNCDSQ